MPVINRSIPAKNQPIPYALPSPVLLRRFATILMCILLSNCQISVKPREATIRSGIHEESDLAVDLQQIRLKMRSLVDPMCGKIEAAADEIIASSSDPKVRRAAVEWKSEAVPALRESLYQPEPLRALFDTWAFTNQMAVFFSSGPGASALGPMNQLAVRTSLDMERQIRDVAASLTKSQDVSKARAAARTWAAAHPIKTRIAHRETTLSQATEVGPAGNFTATETLSDITMTVDDLNRKLEVYTDQILRQVRWEAELISMDLEDRFELDEAIPLATRAVDSVDDITGSVGQVVESVDEAVTTLDEAMPMLERVVTVLEKAPELVSVERSAAIAAVKEELNRTIQFVREERESALQHITAERLAALQTLHDSIVVEREILTEDIRDISRDSIDHAFWRAAQLVGAVVAILILVALVALFLVRRMILDILEQTRAEVGN